MILTRYVIRGFIPPLLLALAVFTGVLFMDKAFELADLVLNKGVSLALAARMFLVLVPSLLSLSLPMSFAVASILITGRMSEDNEITAMRSSGINPAAVAWPLLAIGALVSVFLVPFNMDFSPRSIAAFRGIYRKVVESEPLIQIEPKRFVQIGNIRMFCMEADRKTNVIRNVLLYRYDPMRTLPVRIYAEKGKASINGGVFKLQLHTGQMEQFFDDDSRKLFHLEFEGYEISLPLGSEQSVYTKALRELTRDGLDRRAKELKAQGLAVAPVNAEYHLRLVMACAPFVLSLAGIPVGLILERGGKSISFGIGAGVLFSYYLLLIFGLTIAEKGKFPALPSLWLANVVLGFTGIVLLVRKIRQ